MFLTATVSPPQHYYNSTQPTKPITPNTTFTSFTPLNNKPSACHSLSATLKYVNNNNTDTVVNNDDEEGNGGDGEDREWVPSAEALIAAIRKSSSSPIEFTHDKVENDPKLVLPSTDFKRLCLDQLALFRSIVHPNALVSVYVRPAGSYVMGRLELRRVIFYPNVNGSEIIIVVGNCSVPAGLRIAEAALSKQQAIVIPEWGAVVFPLVKQPFVVGFLVAELPNMDLGKGPHDTTHSSSPEDCYALPPSFDLKSPEIPFGMNASNCFILTPDQRSNAMYISRSLASAYVMDQKALWLQQTSWQNNIRMTDLVEQIRGSLSFIRSLTTMLSAQMERSEIAHDMVEDIKVQSDVMQDNLQQLQDAVSLTKANIMRFNEESLKKMDDSVSTRPETRRLKLPHHLSNNSAGERGELALPKSWSLSVKDLEMPMPPWALTPLQQHRVRPCNVSDVLVDLVGAAQPLAEKQMRSVELNELSQFLQVSVEEPSLRQALGNLIEGALLRSPVGGKVEVISLTAPAGGALIMIDDDGPDMHYMTQMHTLTPFGVELFSEKMVEDNMAWNFVAGVKVAQEILEIYGCVVRVTSPRNMEAALGAGGTRVEVWLPSPTPDHNEAANEA